MQARIRGAVAAKGPVLTFLDSHIECIEGWLEPLLARIAENPTIVPSSDIISINKETFRIKLKDPHGLFVGGFNWELWFIWVYLPKRLRDKMKHDFEPMPSPTMCGGIFSIDKAFFERIGMYDPQLETWGYENVEISFKAWMCGGSLEQVPCSQVAHIYCGRKYKV